MATRPVASKATCGEPSWDIVRSQSPSHGRSLWEAFADHVRFLCRLQAEDRGLADLLTTHVTAAPELEELRGRAYVAFIQIADRAQGAGVLLADFTGQDLVSAADGQRRARHRTAGTAPTAWQRFVDLQPTDYGPVPPPRPRQATADAIEAAMRQRGHDLGYC